MDRIESFLRGALHFTEEDCAMRWNTQTFMKFCKDRSGYIGLSFVVGVVCLWSVACGRQGTELELYDAGGSAAASTLQQANQETEESESQQKKDSDKTVQTQRNESGAAADSGATVSAEEEEILVFVCGAVKKEGVYSLGTDARVYEAVAAAGGFAEEADRDAVNLAMPMHDGEQLRIPTEEEIAALSPETGKAPQDVTGGSSMSGGVGISGGISESENNTGEASDSVEKIDLNTATREQLMTVPGIGGVRADAILEYRESSGRFRTIEEIQNVSGIKAGIYAKIQNYIAVE